MDVEEEDAVWKWCQLRFCFSPTDHLAFIDMLLGHCFLARGGIFMTLQCHFSSRPFKNAKPAFAKAIIPKPFRL